MTDFFGNELCVGDYIAVSENVGRSSTLVRAQVIGFKPKKSDKPYAEDYVEVTNIQTLNQGLLNFAPETVKKVAARRVIKCY